MLPPNSIIMADIAHAAVPANWTRDTRFDGNYVKATTSDWGNTGGSATHSHTSPSQSHSFADNGHVHATGTIGSGTPTNKTDAQHQDSPPQEVSPNSHTHSGGNSGAMTAASCSSVAATIGNANNEYSRYHFIFLKSTGYNFYPTGGIVLRNDANSRSGATHFDAADGRYIKGAATGADAGSATDVVTHNHTQTHTHVLAHTHGSINSGGASGLLGGKDINSDSPGNHSHTISFTQHQENATNSTAVPNFTNDLAYKELHFWKADSILKPIPGDIALYTETVLPPGWSDLGLSDVYIKGKTSGGALTTGGALTQTHTGISHNHVGSSHTHPFSSTSTGGSNQYRNGGSTNIVGNHTHSGTTGAGTNATTGTETLTFSTDNYEPLYIKVRYIQMLFDISGAAAALVL